MPFSKLASIVLGDKGSIDVIIVSADILPMKTGKYTKYTVQDTTGTSSAVMDFDNKAAVCNAKAGDIVTLSFVASPYKGGMSLHVTSMAQCSRSPEEFIRNSTMDMGTAKAQLRNYVNKINNQLLKELVSNMIFNNIERFAKAPAASGVHHNWVGGLLEHTLSLLSMVSAVHTQYIYYFPKLDSDFIYAGILIHDWGKILELNHRTPAFDYTEEGNLIGHISLCVREIYRASDELKKEIYYDSTIVQHLVHIVLSHHGKKEWGSSITPMTPEAVLVHQLDLVDSSMMKMYGVIEKTFSGGMTSKDIDGNRYKRVPILGRE